MQFYKFYVDKLWIQSDKTWRDYFIISLNRKGNFFFNSSLIAFERIIPAVPEWTTDERDFRDERRIIYFSSTVIGFDLTIIHLRDPKNHKCYCCRNSPIGISLMIIPRMTGNIAKYSLPYDKQKKCEIRKEKRTRQRSERKNRIIFLQPLEK